MALALALGFLNMGPNASIASVMGLKAEGCITMAQIHNFAKHHSVELSVRDFTSIGGSSQGSILKVAMLTGKSSATNETRTRSVLG